jgi:hypothetical protein
VAGGDHHAGVGTEVTDGEGDERGGVRARQDQRRAAGGRDHPSGVLGELRRAVSGVAPHDHPSPGPQMSHQPRRGLAHHQAIHAVRSRSQGPTQPRRPELESPPEPIGQLDRLARGDERGHLAARGHVGIGIHPGDDPGGELLAHQLGGSRPQSDQVLHVFLRLGHRGHGL